jgi:hypothetical protein
MAKATVVKAKTKDKPKAKTTKKKLADKIKALHSITFYIPAKSIDFFTEALKEVSKKIYKGEGKRTVSKYIRDLIYKDLQNRKILDDNYNPNQDALEKLKKEEINV